MTSTPSYRTIGQLTSLEKLNIANNKLSVIPWSIKKLIGLKDLRRDSKALIAETPDEHIKLIEELEGNKIVEYNGLKIIKRDLDVLTELEGKVGKIPIVSSNKVKGSGVLIKTIVLVLVYDKITVVPYSIR